jgi:membrane protein
LAAPPASGDPSGTPAIREEPGILESVAARLGAGLEPIMSRILGVPRLAMAHAVLLRFSSAGGPVLARGLAFVALFALVPALLVVVSIAGLLVRDEVVRDRIKEVLLAQFPPLEGVLEDALRGAGDIAATTGLVGIVLLVWSASGLVRALDGAFRVVFKDVAEGRTPMRDLVAVAAVAGTIFGAAIVVVLLTLPSPIGQAVGVPGPLVQMAGSIAMMTGLVSLAYRFVPRPRPGWRVIAEPALTVGLAIWLLTSLFATIGPLLLGPAQLYSAFAALFLGLIWLGNVTQLIVLGAAWVAERDRRVRGGPPRKNHEARA